MEQILINLIAGAAGGGAAGKASPQFDLGMIGNLITGAVGGGRSRPDRDADLARCQCFRRERQFQLSS